MLPFAASAAASGRGSPFHSLAAMKSIWPLLLITTLTGCTTVVDYPATWSPVARGQGCAITGTYLNRGEAAGGYTTHLSDWLFKPNARERKRLRSYQELYIATDSMNAIVIDGIESSDSVPVRLTRIEKYECKDGILSYSLSALGSGDNVVSIGSSRRLLYRGGGHLVVESAESGVGLVLLIPVVGSANDWARFAMVDGKQ